MNRLREIRREQGVSKWRLAQITGLNWKTIHRIEQNKHTPFERSKEKIAQALSMTVEDIFPPTDVEHIFITKPRIGESRDQEESRMRKELEGYLLDRNMRRCPGVDVQLVDEEKTLSKVKSEQDGRFIFEGIEEGKYRIVSMHATKEIMIQ